MAGSTDSSKLAQLEANPLAQDVRMALASYIDVTGLGSARPADEWTVRPLPGTKARKDRRRLFTVNVSNMETLYGHFNPQTGHAIGGCLLVWHELISSLPRLSREFEIDFLDEADYQTAEGKARALIFLDLQELAKFLRDAEIASAAERLVTYLRSHGQVPGMQRRWHNPAFKTWLEVQ